MFKVGILSQSVGGGAPTSVGPLNPTSAFDAGLGDDSWINVNNVFTANNQYAICAYTTSPSQSNYLQTYNHGFSIPVVANITGIEVQIKAKYAGVTSPGLNELYLWTNGQYPVGSQVGSKFPNTTFTTTNTIYTYGGPGDLWGYVGITPANVNNIYFGVISTFLGFSGDAIEVDNINIKIYYTP